MIKINLPQEEIKIRTEKIREAVNSDRTIKQAELEIEQLYNKFPYVLTVSGRRIFKDKIPRIKMIMLKKFIKHQIKETIRCYSQDSSIMKT